jgi:hypothetical protein
MSGHDGEVQHRLILILATLRPLFPSPKSITQVLKPFNARPIPKLAAVVVLPTPEESDAMSVWLLVSPPLPLLSFNPPPFPDVMHTTREREDELFARELPTAASITSGLLTPALRRAGEQRATNAIWGSSRRTLRTTMRCQSHWCEHSFLCAVSFLRHAANYTLLPWMTPCLVPLVIHYNVRLPE